MASASCPVHMLVATRAGKQHLFPSDWRSVKVAAARRDMGWTLVRCRYRIGIVAMAPLGAGWRFVRVLVPKSLLWWAVDVHQGDGLEK